MTLQLLRTLILISITLPLTTHASTHFHSNQIFYDKNTDHLSIDVQFISLKSVMKKIAYQTGIEVLFDDKADATLSIKVNPSPLKKALENLLKGHNYSLHFDTNKNGKALLTSAIILPADAEDQSHAKRILNIEKEAQQRAISQISLQKTNEIDLARERWLKRLDNMPDRFRKNLEIQIDNRLTAKALRDQERENKRNTRNKKRDEAKATREKNRNIYLDSLPPEQRITYEQQSNEQRNQITQQLLPQLQAR